MKARQISLLCAIGAVVGLAGVLLIVLASASAASPTGPASTWIDDFGSATLDGEWSWVREDATHWSLTDNPGFMRITLQQGGLLGPGNDARNLLVREAPAGDFEIETRVLFMPSENFQIAGLLVYQDDDNFLMLGRAFCGAPPPYCAGNAIYFDHEEEGQVIGVNHATYTSVPGEAYLRIMRHGTVYTGFVSENGLDWSTVGVHTVISGLVPSHVGLAVDDSYQGATEIPADFDYFRLEAAPVVTIGVASALSVIPDLGWRQLNAAQLAVDQVNAAGGIDIGGMDYTLVLSSTDSGCNPGQATVAANALLGAGAVGVVGHTCTSASMAAQPVYGAAGVPMISPSSTAPDVTEQGYSTTFRVITRDDSPPILLATQMRKPPSYDRAAIVEMDGFWGNWVSDVFSDTFTSLGGTVTSRRTVASTSDFTPTLTTIMTENPDTIHFANDDPNTAGLLSRVAYNLGMTDVAIAWTTYSENRQLLDDYAAVAGAAAEGDIAAMYHRATEDMPGYDDLKAAYQAAGFPNFGDEPQLFGAFAYDAAQIIISAIDRADSTDPASIRDEIAATADHRGVVGIYLGFDAKGDVIPQWMWLERFRNGRWQIAWPYHIFAPVTLKSFGP